MMVVPLFVPRSVWRSTPPDNNDGTPRLLLVKPVQYVTVHYTGSPIRSRASTDPVEVYMPWMEGVADATRKSFEYNYVIPPRADRSSQVWEYAGPYQAAHSAGENSISLGVQFAIGVDNYPSYVDYDWSEPTIWQPLEDGQVEAFRFLMWKLRQEGLIDDRTVMVRPHKDMPGAATPCPGASILARWDELLMPWNPQENTVQAITPVRLMDTRDWGPRVVPGETVTIRTPNRPSWARSAIVNITVTEPTGPGFVVAWGPGWRPETSDVNWHEAGAITTNSVLVQLDGDLFHVSPGISATHLVIDQKGWAS